MAKGHFIVLRLERTYGNDVVQAQYNCFAKLESPRASQKAPGFTQLPGRFL